MQHSDQPINELARAREEIAGMRNSTALDEFEEHWKGYLHRIERVWTKAINHFGRSPKFNGWKGTYEQARKSDALLSYLINARGADEHTVTEITERTNGGFTINPAEGNFLHIEHMHIGPGGLFIKSPQDVRVEFLPARTKLQSVTNRGRTYPVPTEHQGKPIDSNDIIGIAEAGLLFYETFLARAEEKFVTSR